MQDGTVRSLSVHGVGFACLRLRAATPVTDRPDFSGVPAGVRTLAFSGEHDTVTSGERQRAFAARIPGSRFLTVPDTDHWVVLERAEDVAELVSRFFTDGPLERAPAPAPVPRPVPPPARGAAFRELPSLAVG